MKEVLFPWMEIQMTQFWAQNPTPIHYRFSTTGEAEGTGHTLLYKYATNPRQTLAAISFKNIEKILPIKIKHTGPI